MKRLLVIFDHILTFRSYTETGILVTLNQFANVSTVFVTAENADYSFNYYDESFSQVKLNRFHRFLLSVNSVRYWIKTRKKSKSFSSRIRSIVKGRREFYQQKNKRIYKVPMSLWVAAILTLVPFKYLIFLLKPVAKRMFSNIRIWEFDMVLYVGTGGSLFLNDCIADYIKKQNYKISYKFISENWDNISSKAVFNIHPDKLGVWGQNGMRFCEEIHGIDPTKVVSVGSPRVDFIAKRIKETAHRNVSDATDILFLGGSLDFVRDYNYFSTVKNILMQESSFLNLLYLPHPKNYSDYLDRIQEKSSTITFQDSINTLINKSLVSLQLPPLEFYVNLFAKCRFSVSPLSTMNLESLLFGIPTIAIDFQEEQLSDSPWATDFFEHFSELHKYDGVKIVRSDTQLTSAIKELINFKEQFDLDIVADYDSKMSFEDRIMRLIND